MEERWNEIRSEAQERWSRLTEEDVEHIAGRVERLIDRLQLRYGYTLDRARLEAKYFMEEQVPMVEARAEQVLSTVQRGAREHPWHLLALGILIGYLIALLTLPDGSDQQSPQQ